MITFSHFNIREIRPEDKGPLEEGLSLLSSQSRHFRFFSSRKNFTEKELKYFTEVDQVNHLCFVAGNMDNNGPTPAGSIRAIRDAKRPEYAELAVTIIDMYHGQGLGKKMLEVIAEAALKQNINYLFGDFHTSNTGMLRLLENYCKRHHIPNEKFILKHINDGFLYFEMSLVP